MTSSSTNIVKKCQITVKTASCWTVKLQNDWRNLHNHTRPFHKNRQIASADSEGSGAFYIIRLLINLSRRFGLLHYEVCVALPFVSVLLNVVSPSCCSISVSIVCYHRWNANGLLTPGICSREHPNDHKQQPASVYPNLWKPDQNLISVTQI